MAKIDIYQDITDKIVSSIEKGVLPWRRPWNASIQIPRRFNGTPYRGVNVILLWIAEIVNHYSVSTFMTFAQAKALKASVRKGEKGHLVVKFGTFTAEDKTTGNEREIIYLKHYTVFNVDQIDGLDVKPTQTMITEDERHSKLLRIINNSHAKIYNGVKAFYNCTEDSITIPFAKHFHSLDGYFAVLFHELGHWTGHKNRLNRDFEKKHGITGYAFEELIAELTACFVCANYGMACNIDNHAAYIDSWLKELKKDKRYFSRACSYAQKAADYLLQFEK